VSCAMDFAVAVRSVAVRVGVPPRECRACRQPTPPTLATPSRELIFFWPATTTSTMMPAAHLPSIVYQHFTLCPSSSQRIISNRHFPRPTSLFIDAFIIHTPSPFIRSYHTLLACHICPRTRSVHPPELSLSLSTNRHWRSL